MAIPTSLDEVLAQLEPTLALALALTLTLTLALTLTLTQEEEEAQADELCLSAKWLDIDWMAQEP